MNSRDRHPRLPQHGRRGRRAHRWLRTRRYVVAGALLCAAVAALLAVAGTRGRRSADVAAGPVPEATPAEATQAAVPTSEPTAEPTPATTQALPVLTPDPPGEQRPDHPAWGYGYEVYTDGQRVDAFESDTLSFPEDGTYTALEGVLTFRGGNLRQNGAYGSAALEARDFKVLWSRRIGAIDSGYTRWTGVGWTGQPVLVRWPEDLRRGMNIDAAFQSRDDLVEGIYGTLDGNIYFFEAGTGKPTRPPIKLGFPIKGSVSVDPRGYPLLYVGQGISRANGRTGSIGWRVYSLIDQRELFFLDGRDPLCPGTTAPSTASAWWTGRRTPPSWAGKTACSTGSS